MKSHKKVTMDDTRTLTPAVFFLFLGLIFIALLASRYEYKYEQARDELSLIKHLGTTYYTGDTILIRFNATDPLQLQLVKKIEEVCRMNNIPNCMNGNQRFYP